MKTPGYWSDLNPLSLLLSPLGLLYNLGTRLNMSLHKPQKAAVPVVCIGNLSRRGNRKNADGRFHCQTHATGKTQTIFCFPRLWRQLA